MNADITELNNTLNITNFLNETASRTLKEEFPTTTHRLNISITDSAYEGVNLLNITVIQYKYENEELKSDYSLNLRIRVRIKEQCDTNTGINPGVDRMDINKLNYTIKNGPMSTTPIATTAPLHIDKLRNPDGMYTYEDIAQTLVEIITAIRHRAV